MPSTNVFASKTNQKNIILYLAFDVFCVSFGFEYARHRFEKFISIRRLEKAFWMEMWFVDVTMSAKTRSIYGPMCIYGLVIQILTAHRVYCKSPTKKKTENPHSSRQPPHIAQPQLCWYIFHLFWTHYPKMSEFKLQSNQIYLKIYSLTYFTYIVNYPRRKL